MWTTPWLPSTPSPPRYIKPVLPPCGPRSRASALDCRSHKLLLVGQSAGGNLVANVCMEEVDHPEVKPLCAVIAYAPWI